MPIFGRRVAHVPKHMRSVEEDSDTDISHHGIKGMKWGIRRYQDVNGRYTTEGKLRRQVLAESNDVKKRLTTKAQPFVTEPIDISKVQARGSLSLSEANECARLATDISDKTYAKINELYRSMPLADRRMIDPDISDEPQDYFKDAKYYHDNTAFNAVSDHGFIIAEKIPADKNIDGTYGVEIGIGVTEKGRGVGTGLTKDLVDWFDGQDEYDVMWWPVDESNKGSIRIAEKNGFVKDPLGSNYIYAKKSAYSNLGLE